jgi:6,7-dimethyl-8-ribityllumazine synthase
VSVYEGASDGGGRRVAVVVARWNTLVTRQLLAGAEETLRRHGVAEVDVAWVPGSFELPQAARWLAASGRYDAVVGLGCVIRGATPHFDHIARVAIDGLAAVAADTGVPVGCGVLTTDTAEQALERAGLKGGNKGAEAAAAALEMAGLRRALADGA